MRTTLNWVALCRLAPRLPQLRAEIIAVRSEAEGRKHFCANRQWHEQGGFKDRVSRLVGWESDSEHTSLRGAQAYDFAYRHLHQLLPSCRACWCMNVKPCAGCEECGRLVNPHNAAPSAGSLL
jgi:hypothetical protein